MPNERLDPSPSSAAADRDDRVHRKWASPDKPKEAAASLSTHTAKIPTYIPSATVKFFIRRCLAHKPSLRLCHIYPLNIRNLALAYNLVCYDSDSLKGLSR